MDIIDFHTHILPEIDDGSQSTQESVQLLKMLTEQNVKTVVATPHFHPAAEHLDMFLQRRNEAYNRLIKRSLKYSPRILLGAEVEYYDDICCDIDGLKALCIEGTNVLLIEMPNAKWSEKMTDDILCIAESGEITVVLAHIERYISKQSNKTIKQLLDSGVLMQVNATFFTSVFTKGRALSMLQNGTVHLVGSDCHGISRRPPYIKKAYEIIEKKNGADAVNKLISFSNSLIN
ncbi:MAG: histidinol-phosphatase [Clostridia bacterium]|nr:histidinol-phosphatase [Clostridia bacterium]